MKKLKITLGFLFVLQMFAFGSFAANKSGKIESKKQSNKAGDCCTYWGGTTTFAVQCCGYGDLNCEYAAIAHDFFVKGKIMVLSRRKK